MCLRDKPTSLGPDCVGQNTLVKISRPSRRSPFSARPSTDSAFVRAYTSAVSNVVMPLSRAVRTHASACSSSTWLPWVSQLPYEISVTSRPLRPRCRYSMSATLCPVPVPSTTWVRDAHGDAWQTLSTSTQELPGVRLSATGLPHPQWNNGDVDDPTRVDVDAVRSWYAALGVPWGMRVPVGAPWRHGRHLFTKRLMGVTPETFVEAREVPDVVVRRSAVTDLDDALVVDTAAFEESAEVQRPWLQLLMAHPSVITAVAEWDGGIVATGSVTLSDGRAGPAGYVAGIAVLPQVRRRGIGAGLTSWLTRSAFEAGAGLCHLHPDTDEAVAIYRRLGYVEVGGLDIYIAL